ncbi:glutamate receptor 2.9-like isoform X1 [Solanum dulcamara]|uniref:glutamate receptor 2.9-like isoform X1 n=1 Tax=Solanum dulcamara TaxID=45834 RepID=UPI0024867B17|nr:glutamate receptor 2.9-like isoform X1 [Solanum dulcamara]
MSAATLFSLLVYFLLLIHDHVTFSLAYNKNGSIHDDCNMIIWRIGAISDPTTRLGKEQKIAMEMAVDDFNAQNSKCSHLVFNFAYSHGPAASLATYLANKKQVHAILGSLTQQEAALFSDLDDEAYKGIPVISLSPAATYSTVLLTEPPSLIQMSNDVYSQMQCLAALIGHFKWRKVIALYEISNSFSNMDSGLITHFSDSLKVVDSSIEYHLAFPPLFSMSNAKTFIQEELEKLRTKNVKVFVVLQCSLEFGLVLFEMANGMGMIGENYVWIISDNMASLLDSVEPSVLLNMQGVIGFKANVNEKTESFKEFNVKFRRKYRSQYPEEEEGYPSPSSYALKAYDATWATAKAMQKLSRGNSSELVKIILLSDFEGLSGKVSFKNGMLYQKTTFRIVNVIGKSYREVSFWSPEFGFSKDLVEYNGVKLKIGNGLGGDLGSILWPGGKQTVPKGWTIGGPEKPLKIGVPAKGAFNQFVTVNINKERNETLIDGFSVHVFEAVVRELPYYLPYVLVPFNGTYDEMVVGVSNKNLDAAVGDTDILADRYEYAEFSQPYIDSGLVMVVTERPRLKKHHFIVIKAFKLKLWIQLAVMSMSTGVVIWLNEYVNDNPDFRGSFPQLIGSVLWFSVTVLSFSQRESIKSNLSRLVLTTWLCVVVVVTACFTAVLSSIMTVPRLEPSLLNVDYLLRTNAPVGCNGNSFIVRYLVNLQFKPGNIKKISSISDYPKAFGKGEISAAFFVAPHAKVFLAKYCRGYTKSGPVFKLGGFGFVFPKGSPLAVDISEAVLKVSQSGEINQLEEQMLSSTNCSSSSAEEQVPGLGPELFSGPLLISGVICGIVLLISIARLVRKHWLYLSSIIAKYANIVLRWASLALTQCYTRIVGPRLVKNCNTVIDQRPNIQQNGEITEVF